jgi:hypothetical protein
MIVGGRGIDLEVAGVNQHTERRVNGKGDAIDQTMCDPDGMDRECARFEMLARVHFAQISIIEQPVLVELVFNVSQRKLSAPDWYVEFGENPRQRADMILMAVRKNDAAHALAILREIRNVGNDNIDAQQLGFGEHQAGVDHNNVVAPTDGHAVHTELAKAPKGDNLQFSSWHGVLLMLADCCAYRTASKVRRIWRASPHCAKVKK